MRWLGWRELALFLESWLTLAWIDFVIRLFPYARWRHWLEPESTGRRLPPRSLQPLATAVTRAARRHYLPMNCLRRSLALRRLLQRRGIASRLHFGIRHAEEGMEAHAWLSHDGTVLDDGPNVAERYAELKKGEGEGTLFRELLDGKERDRVDSGSRPGGPG